MTASDKVILECERVSKSYGPTPAVSALSMSVREGEFLSVIGPSGSGKSTVLKMLAGVETPTSGRIAYAGKVIHTDERWPRDIVMVWQSLALFPHLNVANNVAFGLRVRGIRSAASSRAVAEALSTVGLSGMERRSLTQLSGGELQRVALARAIVVRPKVLLLDEPLGSLDPHLRGQLQTELRRLHDETKLTFVMVTHDQAEAMSLSDRIGVMNKGRLEQLATPAELDACPQTEFVASFVGKRNAFLGTVVHNNGELCEVQTDAGIMRAPSVKEIPVGTAVICFVDATQIRLGSQPTNTVSGIVRLMTPSGTVRILRVEPQSSQCVVCELRMPIDEPLPRQGDRVTLSWPPEAGIVLPRETNSEIQTHRAPAR